MEINQDMSQDFRIKHTTEDFFVSDPTSNFSIQIQTILPDSSLRMSGEDSMTAYVVQYLISFETENRETAGHEKWVEGPKVWDMAGCKVNIYTWN